METSKLILSYIKAFTTPQIIWGTVILIFLFLFKKGINNLIDRIAKIKFPGGGEVSTPQSLRSNEEKNYQNVELNISEEAPLPTNLELSPEQVKELEEIFKAERAKAAIWEYRYLNYYLAPHTQRVLDWIATLELRTTISMFDSLWLPIIPAAKERRAIINALQSHYLIVVINEELIEVTPKGKEYIQWRGPLLTSST